MAVLNTYIEIKKNWLILKIQGLFFTYYFYMEWEKMISNTKNVLLKFRRLNLNFKTS